MTMTCHFLHLLNLSKFKLLIIAQQSASGSANKKKKKKKKDRTMFNRRVRACNITFCVRARTAAQFD